MSKKLNTQEVENIRQAAIISSLEAALTNDRKYKPEVLEAGTNKCLKEILMNL